MRLRPVGAVRTAVCGLAPRDRALENPDYFMINRLSAVLGLMLISVRVGLSATWYVDSAATGSNNGTSWTNAWTSLNAISGIASGDTVYISGGPSGSTRNYTNPSGGFPPYMGSSSSSRITYQIGQDSLHNGTAIINGGGGYFLNSNTEFANILGSDGDGQRHFSVINITGIGYMVVGQYFRIAYVTLNGGETAGLDWGSGDANPMGLEFDHCYVFKMQEVNQQWDHFLGAPDTFQSGYGVNKIHDNFIYLPRDGTAGGDGDDNVTLKSGFDMYNNYIYGYVTNYTGSQHQDGFQTTWSTYVRVYNNYFVNMANAAGTESDLYADINTMLVYNNIVTCDNVNWAGEPMRGFDLFPGEATASGFNYRNVLCANNLIIDLGPGPLLPSSGDCGSGDFRMDGNVNGNQLCDYFGCSVVNNLTINCNGGFDVQSDVTNLANIVDLSPALAAALFKSYTQYAATNNNFHLTAAATSLIGKGINLSAYIASTFQLTAIDFDGNTRPSSGPWDIGPYMYNSVPSTNPVIALSPSSINFGSLLPNTSVTNSIVVQNIGVGTLIGSASVPAPFAIVGPASYSLTNNQSQNILVSFSPGASTNTFANVVTFTGGGGASASVSGQTVAVMPGLTFPSSAGAITSPMATNSAGYVYLTTGDGTEGIASGGSATYFFNVTNSGPYIVSANVLAPNAGTKSFWVNIDAMPVDPTMICDVYPYSTNFQLVAVSWRGNSTTVTNDQFSPEIFSLSSGTHELIFVGREQGVELGAIMITPYSSSRPGAPHLISVAP
jgi:hypothetical protein